MARHKGHNGKQKDKAVSGDARAPRKGANLGDRITRKDWLIACGIFVWVFVVFGRTVGFDFVNMDDDINVIRNPLINAPSWRGLAQLWSGPHLHLYVPLAYSSWLFDWIIGGGKPWAFHFSNVAIHGLASGLSYVLIRALLRDSGPPARFAAAAGALLFAIHPAQAEAVSWITARKDVLSGCLGILSAIFYFWLPAVVSPRDGKYNEQLPEASRARLWCYVLALTAYGAALLAKPGLVSLPAAFLVIDAGLRRNRWLNCAKRLLPFFALAFVWTIITAGAQPVPQWLREYYPMARRPVIAAECLGYYFVHLVAPWNLVPVFPKAITDTTLRAGLPWLVLFTVLTLLLLALAVKKRLHAPMIFFAAFSLCLAPVLGLAPYLYQGLALIADRYLYFAMIIAGIAFAWGLRWLQDRADGGSSARKRVPAAVAITLLAVWSGLAWRQAQIWKDSETLWRFQTRVAPNVGFGFVKFGQSLVAANRTEEAAAALERSISLDPLIPEARVKLGMIRMNHQKRSAEAEALFQQAVDRYKAMEINDLRLAEALNNIGVARMRLGRWDDAVAPLREAAALQPGHAGIAANLKGALQRAQPGAAAPE